MAAMCELGELTARSRSPLGERRAESGRIRLLAFPGHREALQATRHVGGQQGRLVADHLDRMWHATGKSSVCSRSNLLPGCCHRHLNPNKDQRHHLQRPKPLAILLEISGGSDG